jgi:prepilin-type processing-associated H-X9-DG protein
MKTHPRRKASAAMTLIEVLVVILCVVIAFVVFLPLTAGSHKAPAAPCLSRVRQINLGFQIYADDYGGKFPMQCSVTNGGTREFFEENETFPHFQELSGYVRYLPTLVCPLDRSREAAQSYGALTDTNLSYFISATYWSNRPAACILSGDRNLGVNDQPIAHGTVALTTDQGLGWTGELHRKGGTLGFADGHVEFCQDKVLNAAIRSQPFATTRLSIP